MTTATATQFVPATVSALSTPAADLANSIAQPAVGAPNASDQLVLLPAGFFGDILGGFASAIGGGIGALAGNEKLGKDIGSAAAPFIKMLPWSVVPAGLEPQSVGPGQTSSGPDEHMMFVPAGLVGNLLGSFAGVIGYGAGSLLGNKELGEKVGEAAAPYLKMLPWAVIPAGIEPQSASPGQPGTDGQAGPKEDMIFVPAGIFGNLLSGFAGLIGQGVGALAGNSQLGKQIGDAASPFLKMLPWSVVPAGVTPQSVVPGATPVQGPDEDLMLVPAGIFGSLLGGLAGSLAGGAIGGLFGNSDLGKKIGSAIGGVGGGFLPFSVVPVIAD